MTIKTSAPRLDRLAKLMLAYGDGLDGSAPTQLQWQRLAQLSETAPVTLLNHFKWRAQAQYVGEAHPPCTGQEAFGRYSAVSMGALGKVGGQFASIAPAAGSLVGPEEDWDLVVVAHYPTPDAVFALFEDAEYCACYTHRIAACQRQRVMLGAPRL